MKNTMTKLQEVLFDICDLIDSGEADNIRIKCLPEFDTMYEFLREQKIKLQGIEFDLLAIQSVITEE